MSEPTVSATPITITLNGQPRQVPGPMTVVALLAHCGFPATGVAVARNGSFVPRSQRATCLVQAGDQLECVAPMQGG